MNVIIEGNNIFNVDFYGSNRECIGVTVPAYKEMESTAEQAIAKAEQYYQMLIDHNIIQKPKTQEEINQELMSQLQEQKDFNLTLIEMLKDLKGDKPNEPTEVKADSPKPRNSSRKGKSSVSNGG